MPPLSITDIGKKIAALEARLASLKTAEEQTRTGERPVIVTTAHRGVFFGYAKDTTGETISLRAARLCVYWSQDMKGFMGLASNGPSAKCRIGKPAEITLRNITAVVEVTPDAAKKWEQSPWAS